MIVVDTSVWIDFLEAKETFFDFHLQEMIERGELLRLQTSFIVRFFKGYLMTENFAASVRASRRIQSFRFKG